jgi:hypothetical protein
MSANRAALGRTPCAAAKARAGNAPLALAPRKGDGWHQGCNRTREAMAQYFDGDERSGAMHDWDGGWHRYAGGEITREEYAQELEEPRD